MNEFSASTQVQSAGVSSEKSALSESAPFFLVSGVWLVLGLAWSVGKGNAAEILLWILGLWALSMVDLLALAKAIAAALTAASAEGDKRGPAWMQALYWGALKLACLGLFIGVLIRGESIPGLGLLIGFGTLVVVPLVGGFWWSQRALRHA